MNPQCEYNKRIYLYSGKRTIKQESENTDCLDSSDSLSPTDAQRFFFCLFIGNEKRRRTKRCLFEIFENRMVSMLLRLTYRRDGEGDCACVAAGIGGIFIGAITVRLYLRNLASISGRREFSLFYTNVRLKILENFQKACEKIEKKLTYIYEGENDTILFPSKA